MNDPILINGDCLEVMSNWTYDKVDCVICDPPFGTTATSWDRVLDFGKLWECYRKVVKPNGAILLFGSQPFSSLLVVSNLKDFHTEWIWQKTRPSGFVHCKDAPLKEHESIYMFCQGKWTYNPQMTETKRVIEKERTVKAHEVVCNNSRGRKFDNQGLAYPRSIQKFANPNHNNIIQTQKPVGLCEYLIRTYSNEGDTLLDNTCGSGSSLIAGINCNRNVIGIEKDTDMFVKMKARIEKHLTDRGKNGQLSASNVNGR